MNRTPAMISKGGEYYSAEDNTRILRHMQAHNAEMIVKAQARENRAKHRRIWWANNWRKVVTGTVVCSGLYLTYIFH